MHFLIRGAVAAFLLCALGAGAQPAPAPKAPLDPVIDNLLQDFLKTGRWTVGYSTDGSIAAISGRPKETSGPPGYALTTLLDEVAQLHGFPKPQFDQHNPDIKSIGDLVQTTYWQTVGGVRVENAAVTITRNAAGNLYDIALSQVPPKSLGDAVRSIESAQRVATAAFLVDIAREASLAGRPTILDAAISGDTCPLVTAQPSKGVGAVLIAADGKLAKVQRITVTASIAVGTGKTKLAVREYAIDATTIVETPAAVVRVLTLLSFSDGKAMLFNPDPMCALGTFAVNPSNSTTLESAYVAETLKELTAIPENDVFFSGALVKITEEDGPILCDLKLPIPTDTSTCLPHIPYNASPDFSSYRRGSALFAGAMAYYHLDTLQRHVRDLKFTMPVIRIDIAVADTNLPYGQYCDCPSAGDDNGYIGLGREGGVWVAEDATVIAHEYGHALLAHGDTKGSFVIARTATNGSEAAEISEGFGDYWAFSSFYNETKGTIFENCYGAWANRFGCERYPATMRTHEQLANDIYTDAGIWSSTLIGIFKSVGANRDIADSIILQGHYLRARVPPAPTMVSIANGIVFAARSRGDVNVDAICAVFVNHKIGPPPCCLGVSTCTTAPP